MASGKDQRLTLEVGQTVTVVKTHWNNHRPAWEYTGTVIPFDHDDWVAVEAHWGLPDTDVEGVRFITGGMIIEYFSPTKRFNIFQVFAPSGEFTGVYANITAPTEFSSDDNGQPVLTWEDHWLDVVRLPDGAIKVLDEEEYQQSGVPESEPDLDRAIRAALAELLDQLSAGEWDF